ncbi:hypothetical protein TNCT_577741 [Trichonephila clavata]|uniref:Uncharacterized protein n=1 Tax=Trichonephila clavata TaxID=2740835 RepID=A0A8X6G568_TRICU|nr:hypothetical protein TNCT_577741 [Trichonephila clavata]
MMMQDDMYGALSMAGTHMAMMDLGHLGHHQQSMEQESKKKRKVVANCRRPHFRPSPLTFDSRQRYLRLPYVSPIISPFRSAAAEQETVSVSDSVEIVRT